MQPIFSDQQGLVFCHLVSWHLSIEELLFIVMVIEFVWLLVWLQVVLSMLRLEPVEFLELLVYLLVHLSLQ